MIIANKKGRNEPCPCESGKKYKNCCLKVDERRERPKQINQAGMLAIFRKLIKDSGGYEINFDALEQIPPDEGINVTYSPENDSFILETVKIKQQKILTPQKRLIV